MIHKLTWKLGCYVGRIGTWRESSHRASFWRHRAEAIPEAASRSEIGMDNWWLMYLSHSGPLPRVATNITNNISCYLTRQLGSQFLIRVTRNIKEFGAKGESSLRTAFFVIHSLPSGELTVHNGKSTIEIAAFSGFLYEIWWIFQPGMLLTEGSVELTHASHATTVATLVRVGLLGMSAGGGAHQTSDGGASCS